ncbi:MAG: EAL domain-containing protein [Rhodospirillales bacterium]|nr:EAL domain-containing protein [Rhodospirillales bacterium]
MAKPLDASMTQEAVLLEKLARIEENPSGYFAVHLHLSELRASNRQRHFINIAVRVFDNLINNADAILYLMMNQDLVLICREVLVEDIDPYINKVRAMFSEDPLTSGDDEFEDKLSTWYDLSSKEDFAAFLSAATELSVKAQVMIEEMQRNRESEEGDKSGDPLSARNLAAINQKLQSTRIADLIRQQACIHIAPGKAGAMVFREHFIAMTELRERVSPGVNLFTSAWLFQYLTETLDKRVLSVIGRKNFDEMKEPISLNLNIGTVLSRDFSNFMRVVGDNAGKIVVELQIIDIFADMNTYGYARDMLQDRGYKVLVDGVNPMALQFFDPANLRPDYIKVAWGKEFEEESKDSTRLAMFRETVGHAGKDSIILYRVDSEKAVKWGLALGISRFQGYFIDKLVQAMTRSKVKPKAKVKAG